MSNQPPDDDDEAYRASVRAAWEQWRPKQFHAYCTHCGRVTKGPQEGRYWPTVRGGVQGVQAADSDRYYSVEEADALGLEHNVSGAICSSCANDQLDQWRARGTPPSVPDRTGETGT